MSLFGHKRHRHRHRSHSPAAPAPAREAQGEPCEPQPERYYLLPGHGGRALRRKQRMMVIWSLAVGVPAAVLLGTMLWWINTHGR